MITFLSLFLGLFSGSWTVELGVAPQVAEVEVLLNGTSVGVLTEPPWQLECDFGDRLTPHELVAIARDAEGRPLDQARQWINLARPSAAASMVLRGEAESDHPRWIELGWESYGGQEPSDIEVIFDGRPLPLGDDPGRIPLPAYDTDALHFISATIRFSDDTVSRLEAKFGGLYGSEVGTDLTAVAIVLDDKAKLPPLAELQGWFRKGERALEVVGVEEGRVELVVVRDPATQPILDEIAHAAGRPVGRQSGSSRQQGRLSSDLLRERLEFAVNGTLRFISPVAHPLSPSGKMTAELLPPIEEASSRDGGLLWLLHNARPSAFPLQLADAVALAGMTVQAGQKRRAVVLVVGDGEEDTSERGVDEVRAYLARLQVPLHVWTTAANSAALDPWGTVSPIADPDHPTAGIRQLEERLDALRRDLRSQRVVWLQGRHLPHQIELSESVRGVRWAGTLP